MASVDLGRVGIVRDSVRKALVGHQLGAGLTPGTVECAETMALQKLVHQLHLPHRALLPHDIKQGPKASCCAPRLRVWPLPCIPSDTPALH